MTATGPILVVDDDPDIRDVLEMALQARGYEVETACDGRDALDRLSHGLRPSLILLDMMMPNMDGGTVINELRSDPTLSEIPIVLLSGDSTIVVKAAQLHSDGYLVKPIGIDKLASTVERFAGPA